MASLVNDLFEKSFLITMVKNSQKDSKANEEVPQPVRLWDLKNIIIQLKVAFLKKISVAQAYNFLNPSFISAASGYKATSFLMSGSDW
jgi:hypothetical protein